MEVKLSIVLATLLLALAGRSAAGQAGAVGGTIGKIDKSASGDQEQAPRARERHASHGRKPQAGAEDTEQSRKPSCGNIVGTWSWPNGSVMAFTKDGGAGTAGEPPGGTWRCSGSTVVAVFKNGGHDQYVVAPDGNSLSFTTNWLPGRYTATRKQ